MRPHVSAPGYQHATHGRRIGARKLRQFLVKTLEAQIDIDLGRIPTEEKPNQVGIRARLNLNVVWIHASKKPPHAEANVCA